MKKISAGYKWKSGGSLLRGCTDRRQTGMAGVARLQAEERGIAAAASQQIVVQAALDDLAALDHQNGVGVHDGVQAVGDHDGGAVLAKMVDRLLHGFFGFRIQRGSGFIEQDDRRILDQRTRYGDALALAAG